MTELTGTVVVAEFAVVPQAGHVPRPPERDFGNPQLTELKALISDCRGEAVSTLADRLVAAFPIPSGAIKFAVAAQQQASNAPAASRPSPGLKVGMSIGEIVRTADSCHGRAVTEATRLLEEEGIAVVGQAGDAAGIAKLAEALAPDVLITDVRMPPTFTLEGLRAAIALRARSPQIAVLVLSQHLETRYAVELLGEGASGVGYLLKERVTAVDEFISAIRRVASCGTAIDAEMVSLLIGRSQRDRVLSELSQREEEILSLMRRACRTQASRAA